MDELTNEVEISTVSQIVIYTNSTIVCPYCIRAKQMLDEHGYTFDERDISIPEIKAELLAKRPTARTVPQIFAAKDYYIGGCDDLARLVHDLGTIIDLNS